MAGGWYFVILGSDYELVVMCVEQACNRFMDMTGYCMLDLMLCLLTFASLYEELSLNAALQVALVFDYCSLPKIATSLRSCDGRRSCCLINVALIPGPVDEDGEEEKRNGRKYGSDPHKQQAVHTSWSFCSAVCWGYK